MKKVLKTNLALLRFNHGRISQKSVSEATGIGEKILSALETGASKGIEFNTLLKLCMFFNCTPGDFLIVADVCDESDEEELIISDQSRSLAEELVAQGLQRAMQAKVSAADQIWADFDAVREKIQADLTSAGQEGQSA